MYRRICGGQIPRLLNTAQRVRGEKVWASARTPHLVQIQSQVLGQQYLQKRLCSTVKCKANTHFSKLNSIREPHLVRKTGIICSLGPQCDGVWNLEKLIERGLSIVRLNFGQGASKKYQQIIADIRKASNLQGKNVAIALDTREHEIHTGYMKGGEIEVQRGATLMVSTEKTFKDKGDQNTIYVDYENIVDACSVGDLIDIDDGAVALRVTGKTSTCLKTEVLRLGKIGSRKGVIICGRKPVLQKEDIDDLKFGVEEGIDIVFASFVQDKEDVEEIRKAMGDAGSHIPVISKIENEKGLENFEEILDASDGIMVARGDLGVELSPEKVFTVQKEITSSCNKAGKPVIVATQMLDSMIDKPRPTRAEVSDVANAVLDGADCVMLSGATAKGKHPVEAVTMMNEICLEAEATLPYQKKFDKLCKRTPKPITTLETTAIAAVNACYWQNASAIITVTASGKTASTLSKYFPHCPIIAVTRNSHTSRVCQLYRNVYPLLYTELVDKNEWFLNVERMLEMGIEKGKEEGFISRGSSVVLLSGWRLDPDHINTIRIITVE